MDGLKQLEKAVRDCDDIDLTIVFSVMKRKNVGIKQKIKCLARIFHIDEKILLDSFPKTHDNRVLDQKSREIIFKILLEN